LRFLLCSLQVLIFDQEQLTVADLIASAFPV
jgi:hypothetical protein